MDQTTFLLVGSLYGDVFSLMGGEHFWNAMPYFMGWDESWRENKAELRKFRNNPLLKESSLAAEQTEAHVS